MEERDRVRGLGICATPSKTFVTCFSNATSEALYVSEERCRTLQSQYTSLEGKLRTPRVNWRAPIERYTQLIELHTMLRGRVLMVDLTSRLSNYSSTRTLQLQN